MQILFIVDIQPVFLINKKLKKLPSRIYNHINKNNYDYIFSFGFVNSQNSPFVRFWKWNKSMKNSKESLLFPILQNSSNYVIWKNTFSCLNQELVSILDQIQFNKYHDQIYICGVDTDICVLSTCLDLFINNYDIYLLADLCGSDKGYFSHMRAIKILKNILTPKKILNWTF